MDVEEQDTAPADVSVPSDEYAKPSRAFHDGYLRLFPFFDSPRELLDQVYFIICIS